MEENLIEINGRIMINVDESVKNVMYVRDKKTPSVIGHDQTYFPLDRS